MKRIWGEKEEAGKRRIGSPAWGGGEVSSNLSKATEWPTPSTEWPTPGTEWPTPEGFIIPVPSQLYPKEDLTKPLRES